MSDLKLTRRDDPLGAPPAPPQAPASVSPPVAERSARDGGASTTKRDRGRDTKKPGREMNGAAIGGEGPYDGDRLEQTGWRFYETVKAQVQEAAQELSDAGTQVSETALAQAVIALRMPESFAQRKALMEEWGQLTASRRRRRS